MKSKFAVGALERYFVVVLVLLATMSLMWPYLFLWFKPWIVFALGVVIFSIGVHTPFSSLIQPFTKPGGVLALVLLRYGLMPCAAYVIANSLALTTTETIGLLVLGTAPGGAAANVMAYLAKANVGLTVLLTVGSTLLSPLITPALIYLFLHQVIHIDASTMAVHIGLIIFAPISLGLLCAHYHLPLIEHIKKGLPFCAMLMIAMIVACVVARNQAAILQFPGKLLFAVLILNGVGYIVGATAAYLLGWDRASILATMFDYGMFDGAVAIIICTLYFSNDTALAAVYMGVVQNITGPILIRYWKLKRPRR